MEYVHKDGHREVTAAGTVRDRELAAKAADGRTSWRTADDTDKAARWTAEDQPDADNTETPGA